MLDQHPAFPAEVEQTSAVLTQRAIADHAHGWSGRQRPAHVQAQIDAALAAGRVTRIERTEAQTMAPEPERDAARSWKAQRDAAWKRAETSRNQQIMDMYRSGKRPIDIARELGLTLGAVKGVCKRATKRAARRSAAA